MLMSMSMSVDVDNHKHTLHQHHHHKNNPPTYTPLKHPLKYFPTSSPPPNPVRSPTYPSGLTTTSAPSPFATPNTSYASSRFETPYVRISASCFTPGGRSVHSKRCGAVSGCRTTSSIAPAGKRARVEMQVFRAVVEGLEGVRRDVEVRIRRR
jgi:hypothetical protein